MQIEAFWDATEEEALRYISAHQKRMGQWDDLFAHHAMQTLGPHMKRGSRPKLEKFKFYKSEKKETGVKDSEYASGFLDAMRKRTKEKRRKGR